MILFAKIFLCLLLFSFPTAQSQGANAGSEPVNHVVCDQTPAQGMAPYAPDMCRNPLSGGQISRKYLEENPRYAEKVRKKLEEDARQGQKNRAEHQESLAAQEENRERQEQARVAYWAKQEQESRVARELADAESKRRIAEQEAERERQQQANAKYWAKKDQKNRTAQALADAERRKSLAAQEEEQKRQQQVGKEVWYKPVVVPAPSVTTPAPSVTTPALSRVTPAPSAITHAPSRDTPAPSGFVPTPFAYVPPPQVITSGASGYVPSQPVITPAPSKVMPAPSVVTSAGGRDYREVRPQSVATTQFSPAQIAEIKRDGRWGSWVAQTDTEVAGQGKSTTASQQSVVQAVSTNTTKQSQQKIEFVYSCDHFPGQGTLGRSYTDQERRFVADCGVQSARTTAEINASNQRIDTGIKIAEGVQKSAEIAGTGIAVVTGVAEGAILVRGAYGVTKAVLEKQVVKTTESAITRAVDSASTGGINKLGIVTEGVLKGGRSYPSFQALKKALGSAGEGKDWHHIVEQSNVDIFGSETIHNTKNVVALLKDVHYKISGYYSSKQIFTNNMTVREWLRSQTFEDQYQFGLDVLKRFNI